MQVNIQQAAIHMEAIIQAGLVPNLKSSPGVGKSDIVRALATKHNLYVIDIRLSQCDPTDMSGLPTLNMDRTRSHYAAPSNFPLEGDPLPTETRYTDTGEAYEHTYDGWMLFFDEMNSAPLSVQAASYKIVLDRAVGEHKLHKKVAMACAGNLDTDKAITSKLSTAMQSRLVHLNIAVDAGIWDKWADDNDIDYRVRGYIRFQPDMLHSFNPNHADDTFPCPRTWAFASRLLKPLKEVTLDLLPRFAGTIGEGPARQFVGYIQEADKLPTLTQILANPAGITLPEEPSTLYALSALCGSSTDKNNIDKMMQFIERMPIEFQIVTMTSVFRRHPALIQHAAMDTWREAHAEELVG